MKKKGQTRKFSLASLVVILVVLLVVTQLVIAHCLATKGEKLRQLEMECRRLKQANAVLNGEISKIGSLTAISQRAEKLGFAKASQVRHLTPQAPVALNKLDFSLSHSE